MPKTVFISYSSKDKNLKNLFKKHLKVIENEGIISIWDGDLIKIGTEWDVEIKKKLKDADIFIILLSPDSVISEYINSVEVKLALESKKLIFPIVLRPCNWLGLSLSRYQCLPKNGKPVSKFRDKDQVFSDIVIEIRKKLISEKQLESNQKRDRLFDVSNSKEIKELLWKIKNTIDESIKLMNSTPLLEEKRGGKQALILDKLESEQRVFNLCFEYINQRNYLLNLLHFQDNELIKGVESILETIFSYISFERVGFDISKDKWKHLFKSELHDLLNLLVQTILKY